MDQLWAEGWRHFGTRFFRSTATWRNGLVYRVLPLRIRLEKFQPNRSQRRIQKRNSDLAVGFEPAVVDDVREALFHRHKTRFSDNVPDSLFDFVSHQPSQIPCNTLACTVRLAEQIVAVSFLDIGESATSAVYAFFEPKLAKRSLGILMILEEIKWSIAQRFQYLYLGYCYDRPSFYDYKRQFSGVEYLDWNTGLFLPLDPERKTPEDSSAETR
jgi:arginine-tRNA-protein transferase